MCSSIPRIVKEALCVDKRDEKDESFYVLFTFFIFSEEIIFGTHEFT